jgi:FkbM family methyltransferase
MDTALKLKAMLVGSPLEPLAEQVRWVLGTRRRSSHPELAELYLENKRLPEILKRLLLPSSNVLDVGCHIGSFLSLAKKVAPKGQHVAIEALPDKAAWLKRKFPNNRIEQIAISDSCGTASFEQNITHPGHSRIRDHQSAHGQVRTITVPMATLDSLHLGNFDLIKLDIEGAELAALRGGLDLFARCRPALIFECGIVEYGKQNPRPLYELITRDMGYRIFTFGDFLYDKGPLEFDEFRKCGLYPFRAFNFVALPP